MNDTTQTATETKPSKTKPPKKSAKAKTSAPNSKTAKAAEPKVEKQSRAPRESREGWGTFALKLPVPEREAFHKATGQAGASRFARVVLLAFANEDEAAFKSAIAEARKLRA